MRVKTESKKQLILEEALKLFESCGYEAASMAELSRRVGGSKATLYNYFDSKEEIFIELMFLLNEEGVQAMLEPLHSEKLDVGQVLSEFAYRHLALICRSDVIAARRLVIAESSRGDVGRSCFDRAVVSIRAELQRYFQAQIDGHTMKAGSAQVAACQFLALLKAEFDAETLLGIEVSFAPEDVKAYADRAVELFLRAYF